MLRVMHVSDTHLSSTGTDDRALAAARGWRAIRAEIARERPDLVLHTGDHVRDGPDDHAGHLAARHQLRTTGVPTLTVPGNHDVGDHPRRPGLPADWLGPPLTARRRAAWQRVWGPDRWYTDRAGWRIVGINSLLLGSGLPADDDQWQLLRHACRTDRPTVLALHEPAAVDDPAEPDGWATPPAPARHELAGVLTGGPIVLVLCGHIHRHRSASIGSATQLSAPSAAYPIPHRSGMHHPAGDPRPGLVRHDLYPNGTVHSRHVTFPPAPPREDP